MERYFISVDGGGTKTEFYLSDIHGNIIESFMTGSTNYKSVGIEKMYSSLKEGFNKIIGKQGLGIDNIAYIVFGISGCDSESDYKIILKEIEKLNIPKGKYYLCNDSLLAFYAQAEEPGIVVIAGTGSIVLGIDKNHEIKRAGGWGYYFSDFGSGYSIGNELLKRTLLYCDNIYRYSKLFHEVKDYFNAENFSILPYKITEIVEFSEIAKLSRIVTENPDKEEWLTRDILEEGAAYLSSLVEMVYKELQFENLDNINIVFSGGVLKMPLYRELLEKKISSKLNKSNLVFKEQINSPAFGGIKLAMRRYKDDNNEK